jgi:outer membrane lipoprotein SlyB
LRSSWIPKRIYDPNYAILVTLISAATLTSCCANTNSRPDTNQSYNPSSSSQSYTRAYGVVDSIEVIRGNEAGYTGTIVGGVIGGVLGNQVGKGRGNTAATIVGAAGGAVAGHEIEKRNNQANDNYRINVRLVSGRYMTQTQDSIGDIQVGNRVRIENDRIYRD